MKGVVSFWKVGVLNSRHVFCPRYKERVMQLSELMREQIADSRPLERAVRAVESVARHGGAPHLRPASCRLSVFQRELWDVYFALFSVALLLAYLARSSFNSGRARLADWLGKRPASPVKKNQ